MEHPFLKQKIFLVSLCDKQYVLVSNFTFLGFNDPFSTMIVLFYVKRSADLLAKEGYQHPALVIFFWFICVYVFWWGFAFADFLWHLFGPVVMLFVASFPALIRSATGYLGACVPRCGYRVLAFWITFMSVLFKKRSEKRIWWMSWNKYEYVLFCRFSTSCDSGFMYACIFILYS